MLKRTRKGQSLVEYGLILALVSVVAITIMGTMGQNIKNTITKINTNIVNANKAT